MWELLLLLLLLLLIRVVADGGPLAPDPPPCQFLSYFCSWRGAFWARWRWLLLPAAANRRRSSSRLKAIRIHTQSTLLARNHVESRDAGGFLSTTRLHSNTTLQKEQSISVLFPLHLSFSRFRSFHLGIQIIIYSLSSCSDLGLLFPLVLPEDDN